MTIQSTTSLTPRDLMIEGKVLEKESLSIQEVTNEMRQVFKEKGFELDDNTSKFLTTKYYDNILDMVNYVQRSNIYNELEWWQKIVPSPTWPGNIIIIPFAISSIIELGIWARKKDDKPSRAGVFFAELGFGIIATVFIANFIYPVS